MDNEKIRQEWISLMGPIASGHATRAMVSAFDQLTSMIYGQRLITWEEFLGTQTVISVAKKGAEAAHKAGIEGAFLNEKLA